MLSNTVAKAIKFHWGDEAAGTIKFIEMMDKLFDCLNVNTLSAGKKQRKPFQQPYEKSDCDDIRVKVLRML